MKRKLAAVGTTVIMTLSMSVTAFAFEAREFTCGRGRGIDCEVRVAEGIGFRRGAGNYDGAGFGQGGPGRGLGSGGRMLRDGSCFALQQ